MAPPGPPRLNTFDGTNTDADLLQSKQMIEQWLPNAAKEAFDEYLNTGLFDLTLIDWNMDIWEIMHEHPLSVTAFRALTYRNMGRLQFADFAGFGSDSKFKRLENGANVVFSVAECKNMERVLLQELNFDWLPWIVEERAPTTEELEEAIRITSLRTLDRGVATLIRYKHEPRQLSKLETYLIGLGYSRIEANRIDDPRGMPEMTYAFGVNLESTQENNQNLNNPVDCLIMPKHGGKNYLPIFLEAKSMTDKANPNKRQKEEGKKFENLRRRWHSQNQQGPFCYLLLVGGVIPNRYLETEQNQGIDWIYEDRVEDLDRLMEWYAESLAPDWIN